MNPATEYLIRNGLIKTWFKVPCSIFVYNENADKIVVTIDEEFKPSDFYSVKHWHIGTCSECQALPFMDEFRVPKKEIFNHPAINNPRFRIIQYQPEFIQTRENAYNHPMSSEMYSYFFEHFLDSLEHGRNRISWLWTQFVKIYAPHLCDKQFYWFSNFKCKMDLEISQRNTVCTTMKKQWKYWTLWEEFMLYQPAELIFSNSSRTCDTSSSQSSGDFYL